MQGLHEQMRNASKNPKWDLGPQLMNLVHDMVEWFTPDTHTRSFYECPDLFSPSVNSIAAFKVIYNPDAFKAALSSCEYLLLLYQARYTYHSNSALLQAPDFFRWTQSTPSSNIMLCNWI
jgi:hypothetical protein